MTRQADNSNLLTYLLLGGALLFVGVAYALTMPRTITLEDAGLFQMVCHLGGISHPPGYPLFTMLCQQMVWGETVVPGYAVSAVFALGAVAMLFLIARELSLSVVVATTAAAAYGISITFWSQAIIIEVYSLAALLFLTAWWLLLRFLATGNHYYALCLALVVGLGLSNHWPIFVSSCLGFLPLLIRDASLVLSKLRSPVFLLGVVSCFALGLTPYLQLFVISDPEIAVFGAMEDPLKYVSRSYYRDEWQGVLLTDKLLFARWLLTETLTQIEQTIALYRGDFLQGFTLEDSSDRDTINCSIWRN